MCDRREMTDGRADIGAGDEPPSERYETINAIFSRGMLLVGASFRDPDGEALVIAPPGVRIPAPADSGAIMSTTDWRIALWRADANQPIHVDVGRPWYLTPVSIGFVIAVVEFACPEKLRWVADSIEQRLQNAVAVQRPDRDKKVFSFAARWRHEAEATLAELDVVLGSAPGERLRTIDAFLSMAFDEALPAVSDHDRDLAGFDPRLRVGVLRAEFERRIREVGDERYTLRES